MNLLLFITVIFVSFIVVRIGAIAFELTGLEWSLAKFQALSCFSGTGFTTREAELIVGDKRRRRIASVLMVMGNAGLVTLIVSGASALNPNQNVFPLITDFLNTPINLTIILLVLLIFYKIFIN